jgi:hypothetical protein
MRCFLLALLLLLSSTPALADSPAVAPSGWEEDESVTARAADGTPIAPPTAVQQGQFTLPPQWSQSLTPTPMGPPYQTLRNYPPPLPSQPASTGHGALRALFGLAALGGLATGAYFLLRGNKNRSSPCRVWVPGYMTSNGTFVAGHMRTCADGELGNNFNTPGNFNPNTGLITP